MRLWLLACVFSALLIPGSVSSRTFFVDCQGSGDFPTIQEAVDAASDLDTIQIAPCSYDENISIHGKRLYLFGEGPSKTELTGVSASPLIACDVPLQIHGMALSQSAGSDVLVMEDYAYYLTIDECEIQGRVRCAGVYVTGSTLSDLWAEGPGYSEATDSHFGQARFSGICVEGPHAITSTRCTYERIRFGCLTTGSSTSDRIGRIDLWGGPDSYHEWSAVWTVVDTCYAKWSPELALDHCTLRVLKYEGTTLYASSLVVRQCYVLGDLTVEPATSGFKGGGTSGMAPSDVTPPCACLGLVHNTIVGDLVFNPPADDGTVKQVLSNIVGGNTSISCDTEILIGTNLFGGSVSIEAPLGSVIGNMEADPQFCDPSAGDYSVSETSPAAYAGHDLATIGAYLGIGCESVPVRSITWGQLKARYE